MYKDILIATKNKGKVAEFDAFFKSKGLTVTSLLDLDNDIDVIEDGETFEENAEKKATVIGRKTGKPVLADDSGLEVDALNGEPGIYSARYAGPGKDDHANNEKLLQELEAVKKEDRTARFVCALAVYFPDGTIKTVRGTCEGLIAEQPAGEHGFGYDPLFYLPQLDKMMAELKKEEKNELSHRANALKRLNDQWDQWLSKD